MMGTETFKPPLPELRDSVCRLPDCHNKRVLLAFCDTGDTVLFRVTCQGTTVQTES